MFPASKKNFFNLKIKKQPKKHKVRTPIIRTVKLVTHSQRRDGSNSWWGTDHKLLLYLQTNIYKSDSMNKSLDLQTFSNVLYKCSEPFIVLFSAITLQFFFLQILMFIFLSSHVTHCTLIFILTFVQSEINWQAFNRIIMMIMLNKKTTQVQLSQNKPKISYYWCVEIMEKCEKIILWEFWQKLF